MKNKKILFTSSVVILLGLFFAAQHFYKQFERDRVGFLAEENASLFVRGHSPQLGNEDAKVFVIEFLDPECESCRAFYPQVKALLEEFGGKVKFIVRYAAFHKNSTIAIKALEASKKQGKYWESLETLFKYQPKWGDHHNPQPSLIFDYLLQIGVDIDQLKIDMNDPKLDELIAQDSEDLRTLNVRGTPTFFVNGKPLRAFGMDYLKEAIREEVEKNYE